MNVDDFIKRTGEVPDVVLARFWYEDLAQRLRNAFNEENWFWIAAAWAVTQEQRVPPLEGMRLVASYLTSNDSEAHRMRNSEARPQNKVILDDIAILIEHHEPPERSIDAYFFDLTDALLGKSTRTVMGDDPRGLSPVPVDEWAYRDVGFVDIDWLHYLAKCFGEGRTKEIIIDEQGEDQYEYTVKFYNGLARDLNSHSFLGTRDWRPYQVQAVGRFVLQRSMDIEVVWPAEIVSALGAK